MQKGKGGSALTQAFVGPEIRFTLNGPRALPGAPRISETV